MVDVPSLTLSNSTVQAAKTAHSNMLAPDPNPAPRNGHVQVWLSALKTTAPQTADAMIALQMSSPSQSV